MEVPFRQIQPWALVPSKYEVDRQRSRSDAAVYRENFRFVRAERRPEYCAPWVMGRELGWQVLSPVDITFTPLDQIELDGVTEPEAAGRAVNRTELWQREKSHLAVEKSSWLHLHQFSTPRGWENMFLVNGAGTVEWRMGWTADVPRGYFLLILPLEGATGLEVPVGILSSSITARMAKEHGLSIAVKPTATTTVRRGQPIARIVLLHADSLQAKALYPDTAEAEPARD
ncbi:hypothetical protein PEM37_38105 [Streptomyces sp. AD681]|uniref:hypothetical protein n=1 Tax=Streptomyces sp. AD681 TaxID=3019069 RepID=UPI0022F19912|nr:hypothetical protein [Streptomyces sp. AD681]MDA5147331.1 hypothetical protein [Streptomyces sp. AD681]